MKKLFITLFVALVSGCACAQIVHDETKAQTKEVLIDYYPVQVLPVFPGGEQALYKWMAENIQYPAGDICATGRVVVEFTITTDGSVTNARVVRGLHPALDKEALRLVNAMPKWQPAMNDGQPVEVRYNLPVTFRLTADKPLINR